MNHPVCLICQEYDAECWFCWLKNQRVEPESCCSEFNGYWEEDNVQGEDRERP